MAASRLRKENGHGLAEPQGHSSSQKEHTRGTQQPATGKDGSQRDTTVKRPQGPQAKRPWSGSHLLLLATQPLHPSCSTQAWQCTKPPINYLPKAQNANGVLQSQVCKIYADSCFPTCHPLLLPPVSPRRAYPQKERTLQTLRCHRPKNTPHPRTKGQLIRAHSGESPEKPSVYASVLMPKLPGNGYVCKRKASRSSMTSSSGPLPPVLAPAQTPTVSPTTR